MIAFRRGCSRAEVGEKALGRVAFAVVLRGTIVAVKGFGGASKVTCHLFFGIFALTVDQLLRLHT
ncbi:MAG: hypothetical protein OXC62_14330, partial [Aestuariivita sp.]|nr:hypothetical protein [Aestuariivita sp.]